MSNKKAILSSPLSIDQLKLYCDNPLATRLLTADSCIVVTPRLPPGAFR